MAAQNGLDNAHTFSFLVNALWCADKLAGRLILDSEPGTADFARAIAKHNSETQYKVEVGLDGKELKLLEKGGPISKNDFMLAIRGNRLKLYLGYSTGRTNGDTSSATYALEMKGALEKEIENAYWLLLPHELNDREKLIKGLRDNIDWKKLPSLKGGVTLKARQHFYRVLDYAMDFYGNELVGGLRKGDSDVREGHDTRPSLPADPTRSIFMVMLFEGEIPRRGGKILLSGAKDYYAKTAWLQAAPPLDSPEGLGTAKKALLWLVNNMQGDQNTVTFLVHALWHGGKVRGITPDDERAGSAPEGKTIGSAPPSWATDIAAMKYAFDSREIFISEINEAYDRLGRACKKNERRLYVALRDEMNINRFAPAIKGKEIMRRGDFFKKYGYAMLLYGNEELANLKALDPDVHETAPKIQLPSNYRPIYFGVGRTAKKRAKRQDKGD